MMAAVSEEAAKSRQRIVDVEPGIAPAALSGLADRGHRLRLSTAGFGGYQAIRRDAATGVYSGATEMRKDGCAAGY